MGVLPSAAASYGMEVITPAVMDKPDVSSPLLLGPTEGTDGLCEYLDERDPFALLEPLGISSTDPPSSCRESDDFSLWTFRPKNDLPPEDCLDLLSTWGVVEGMSHRAILTDNARRVGAEPFLARLLPGRAFSESSHQEVMLAV